MGLLIIPIVIISILYLYVKFMEGYNSMDMPEQTRRIAKMKEQELQMTEQDKELEILRLRKELEGMKNKE